jgi:putative phage-type endonuclease
MTAATLATARKVTPTGVLAAPHDLPRDEWLSLRKTGIGGSDVAALLGMSKYASPYELYLEKRGELPDFPRPEFLERAAMWGHFHEPLIAAEFGRLHGLRTRRVGLIRHESDPWRLANLDRQVHGCPDGPCLLEIKNRSAWKEAEWGESGDPEGVPDSEALQTHWYIGVTGYSHAHVGVLINGNDDRYYRVGRDEALLGDIVAAAGLFWRRVLDGNPPPVDGSDASTDLLKILWTAEQDSELVVSPAEVTPLLAEVERLKADAGELDERLALAQNRLRVLLGDREVAIADGEPLFSLKQNGTFSAKRFRQAHPDLAAEYEHLVPAIDAKALQADHPDIQRAFRARVLRIPTRGDSA